MIERFWAIVHDELERSSLGIAANCEGEIHDMLKTGVAKIYQAELSPMSPRVIKAEQTFREFVQAMARDARKKGYVELHEDTFAWARKKFCPGFWPFC